MAAQFVIVYATPYMISDIKFGTFFFFAASTLVASIIVYCLMPETKGFTLEDIHFIFENGHRWAPKVRLVGEQLRVERDAELERNSHAEAFGKDKSNVIDHMSIASV